MPLPKKQSLFIGYLLNLLWPGLGLIYFRRVKRGIVFALLGLFFPFLMVIISCVDLYFLVKKNTPHSEVQEALSDDTKKPWNEWDIDWRKPLKKVMVVSGIIMIVAIVYYSAILLILLKLKPDNVTLTNREMQEVRKALEDEFKLHGTYPKALDDLIKNIPLRRLWLKDAWQVPYRYTQQNGAYELVSAGKDRIFNTSDDIYVSGP